MSERRPDFVQWGEQKIAITQDGRLHPKSEFAADVWVDGLEQREIILPSELSEMLSVADDLEQAARRVARQELDDYAANMLGPREPIPGIDELIEQAQRNDYYNNLHFALCDMAICETVVSIWPEEVAQLAADHHCRFDEPHASGNWPAFMDCLTGMFRSLAISRAGFAQARGRYLANTLIFLSEVGEHAPDTPARACAQDQLTALHGEARMHGLTDQNFADIARLSLQMLAHNWQSYETVAAAVVKRAEEYML